MDILRFANRLRSAREKSGFSIRQVCDAVGCSHGFLHDLELGDRFPSSPELVERLAIKYGIDPKQLADDLAYDRSMHWLTKRPAHLSDDQVRRIREIAIRELAA